MKFEDKLQSLRKASSLSQEQLADKLNVSRQSVSKWESGVCYPEMDKLIGMCKIFNCSMDELINEETPDTKIMKGKNTKKNLYIDSILEFITKSVNMFCSMKFSSLIKCFIELGLLVLFLSIVVGLVNQFIYIFLDEILCYNFGLPNVTAYMLSTLILVILVSVAVIVFLQVYKIRYLDYYDKLVYQLEQKSELEIPEKMELKEDKKETKKKEEKIKLEEPKRERIIIRDPDHRPFAFLSVISKAILSIIKFFALCIGVCFVFTLIILVIGMIIDIYLILKNSFFIGIMLGLLGLIIVNIQILYLIYSFVWNNKVSAKTMFIIFLASVLVSSTGAGLSIIKMKDFKIVDNFYKTTTKEFNYEYNDDLAFNNWKEIEYVYDEKVDNVKVLVEYYEDFNEVESIKHTDCITFVFEEKINNYSKVINSVLDGLENNEIRTFDTWQNSHVTIKANKKTIDKLIANIGKKAIIGTHKNEDGYSVIVNEFYVTYFE